VEKFNQIGEMLKKLFPNVLVVGNYYIPQTFESFDVYI